MKKGFNRKKKSVIEYPNIPSAIRPVRHSDELPIPEPHEIDLLSSDDAESSEELAFLNRAHPGIKNLVLLLNHI